MKQVRHFFCNGLLVTALAAWSCAPLIAAGPEGPAPEISLSLRGVANDIVEQGEPLRVVVRLDAPRDAIRAIELAPASGAWSDAITVELARADGGLTVVRAEAVGQPARPYATLSATQVTGGLWRVSSETMRRVAPGNYVVRARLAIRGGRGWTGEVVSDETQIQVVAVSDSADRVAQSTINRAQDALLDGRIEEAASIVDAVLQRTPDDEALLTVRASISERAGNPMAALLCLNRAYRVNPPSGKGPPPLEREEIEARARASLMSDKQPSTNLPAWSWPPDAVLARPEPELPAPVKTAAVSNTGIPTAPKPAAAVATSTPATSAASRPTTAPSIALAPTQPAAASAGGSGTGVIVPIGELIEAKILADPAGQWAAGAKAGSQYGNSGYAAAKATSAPDVPIYGDSPSAWCPAGKNSGTEWLEVAFARPAHATEIRIRQNNAPAAISKIEAFEPDGTAHVWWEGIDPYQAPAVREIVWFAVRVPRTAYLVAKIKITLNLDAVSGWKQIDAVQLVGASAR